MEVILVALHEAVVECLGGFTVIRGQRQQQSDLAVFVELLHLQDPRDQLGLGWMVGIG